VVFSQQYFIFKMDLGPGGFQPKGRYSYYQCLLPALVFERPEVRNTEVLDHIGEHKMNGKRETGSYSPASATPRPHQEISRLLTAAVVNIHFRQMLLANPGKAIAKGYAGEAFSITTDERKRLSSIRATSLADFASQAVQMQDGSRVSAGLPAGD
jgi:hypothetical protein